MHFSTTLMQHAYMCNNDTMSTRNYTQSDCQTSGTCSTRVCQKLGPSTRVENRMLEHLEHRRSRLKFGLVVRLRSKFLPPEIFDKRELNMDALDVRKWKKGESVRKALWQTQSQASRNTDAGGQTNSLRCMWASSNSSWMAITPKQPTPACARMISTGKPTERFDYWSYRHWCTLQHKNEQTNKNVQNHADEILTNLVLFYSTFHICITKYL